MADEYILKSYEGGAETTTLTSQFVVGGSTLSVNNGSSYPDGSTGPFVIVIDRGTATEEKFLIDTATGANKTTFTIQQAAYDGTSANSHAVGAVVEHCLDAYTLEQSNRYVNLQTAQGDLITHNGTTTAKLARGSNNTVLIADSTQTLGIKYATVGSASITDGAITESKIANNAVTSGKIATGAITETKIGDGAVTAAKLAPGAISSTVPTGSIMQFAGATAPSGWLLCDGAPVSQTTYSALFAVIADTYNGVPNAQYPTVSAGQFRTPNLRGKVALGLDPNDSDFNARGKYGGAKTHTLSTAEMPQHYHSHNHFHISSSVSINFAASGSGSTALGAGSGNSLSATGEPDPINTGSAGSSSAHNNLQPYVVTNFIIKT